MRNENYNLNEKIFYLDFFGEEDKDKLKEIKEYRDKNIDNGDEINEI